MKYLKHYWIYLGDGSYCCLENKIPKRHPEEEFPGLNVKIWMHDENGIDLCLSEVPDTTKVEDIYSSHDPNLKVVQNITEEQFNSVSVPLEECNHLMNQAHNEEDAQVAQELFNSAELKMNEAKEALYSL
jgi:hypothetical protein